MTRTSKSMPLCGFFFSGAPLMAALCAALAAVSGGCEETSTGDDGGTRADAQTTDSGGPPEGLVTFKKANEEVQLDVSADSEIVVVPYSVSGVAADEIDFTIKVNSANGTTSRSFKLRSGGDRKPIPLSVKNPRLWALRQGQIEFERWRRGLAARVAAGPLRKVAARKKLRHFMACSASSECSTNEVCFDGNCAAQLSLKLHPDVSKAGSIDVEVKRKTDRTAILVDKSATTNDSDLDRLVTSFDETILPRSVALFGDPPLRANSAQRTSDRNGDGLVWIVISPRTGDTAVNGKPRVGFFLQTDFTEEATSNRADILYLAPIGGDIGLIDVQTILAHELQHLLNFSNKVYRPQINGSQGAIESLWLDEGLSHFAEDACGFGGENTTLLSQELFTSFAETRLFEANGENDGLAMRAMAMTFVRYLFEQKGGAVYAPSDGTIQDRGGAAWLQKLLATKKQGTAAVDESYGDHRAAFEQWIAAVTLDGRGVTDFRGYNFVDPAEDPATKNQIGITIRGKRKDAGGAVVDLEGPLEETLSDASADGQIPNASANFFRISGRSGAVTISVASQATDFRFAVVRLK